MYIYDIYYTSRHRDIAISISIYICIRIETCRGMSIPKSFPQLSQNSFCPSGELYFFFCVLYVEHIFMHILDVPFIFMHILSDCL